MECPDLQLRDLICLKDHSTSWVAASSILMQIRVIDSRDDQLKSRELKEKGLHLSHRSGMLCLITV